MIDRTSQQEQGHGADAERRAGHERQAQQAEERRRHQRETRSEASEDPGEEAVQTAPREEPELPYPEQHLEKPGHEKDLDPRPRYAAPGYRGAGKLAGKVSLITGGDSGIGRSVAVLYAREGADVAIVYLSEDDDAAETKQAVEAEGRRALLIKGDVADPDFCRDAVHRTVEELGGLDVLVNNAAYQEHQKSIEDITDEQLDLTFRTNLYGYFHMARAALPHLKSGSAIVNTGSITGINGSANLLDYSATKGAIHAFTKSLAQNLLEKEIRVNCVAPGPVWTPLNPADRDAEEVASFGESSRMGRPAQPEEIAPAYVFLASPADSSFMTGEIVPVVGGMSSN